MSHDLTSDCQSTVDADVEEMRTKFCSICLIGECKFSGSDQWTRRMDRQEHRAQGPQLIETDLSQYPGLANFVTVENKPMIAVPANYRSSTSDSPLGVSRYNTPNPGRVNIGGTQPKHFQSEVRVSVGGTVQLDE